ncbi:probable ATP-dependent RNA helicase DDX31 [Gigantopelta aegis]|uniref:probable ATP-dependent RNA helicase DDX31 n=1 Tax=Gigantopelta aegis TaxID=1735272 RepID=UPI001B88CD84|nr:probable ATP-dependent RNA helicase DDX31 [Gigantopelta aegis]
MISRGKMNSAEDFDIQLNLCSSQISDNRRSRTKEKPSGLNHKRVITDGTPPSRQSQNQRDLGGKRKLSDSDTITSSSKRKKPDQIISSLFRHNPDIPSVDRSDVTPVKEQVFTSKTFCDLPLHQFMISNLVDKMNLTCMTSIQQRAIPCVLQGGDLLIKSQTGSGKTLAYAVPIVQKLQALKPSVQRSDGPYVIVVVPTRELAIQSYQTFCSLVKPFISIVPGCLMGGEKRKAEKARLRKGINILVTTPGRLVDHLEHTQGMSLSCVQYLVLDEADRLSDLGYEKDIATIVTALNTDGHQHRQTILLSATLSNGVERLAGMALNNPQKISVSENNNLESPDSRLEELPRQPTICSDSDRSEVFSVPDQLEQQFVITPSKLRLVTLAAFICAKCKRKTKKCKMIVFLSTQDSVEFHHALFTRLFVQDPGEIMDLTEQHTYKQHTDVTLYKLHGDMPQKDRTLVFRDFCMTSEGVLFCTDVASRGLHLPHVDWIVQYAAAGSEVEYIHRVGRTARAGSPGHALLFLLPHEVSYIQALNKQHISLDELSMDEVLKTLTNTIQDLPFLANMPRDMPRTAEEAASCLQTQFEDCIHGNKNMLQLARKAFQSFIRAYTTFPSHLKSMFDIRQLHLGHLAKSFGLRDAPSNMKVNLGSKHRSDQHKHNRFEKTGKGFQKKNLSEFESGLSNGKMKGLKSRRKKKKLK